VNVFKWSILQLRKSPAASGKQQAASSKQQQQQQQEEGDYRIKVPCLGRVHVLGSTRV